MHWHAIRQSKTSYESANATAIIKPLCIDGNDSSFNGPADLQDHLSAYSTGDDACDLRTDLLQVSGRRISGLAAVSKGSGNPDAAILPFEGLQMPWSNQASHNREPAHVSRGSFSTSSSSTSRLTEANVESLNSSFSPPPSHDELIPLSSNATVEDGHTSSTRTFLPSIQFSIPTHPTNNLAPFAYQRAMRNRIRDDELSPGRKYDIKSYTPMFVHDCLMMPGSFANLRGKGSAEDVVRRMTPALFPYFHAYVHSTTHEPLLLQSSKTGDYVHGMLVFGQSKDVRHHVHQHYRHFCKRIKVEVELDTVHPVPSHLRKYPGERWELRRRSVWAHAWVWRNAQSGDARFRPQGAHYGWRFDDYLAGKHKPAQSLRIEPAGWIEDERETIASKTTPDESSLTDWKVAADEHFGEWEEGSEEGGAVPFDDDAWNRIPPALSDEKEEGDYDRCGRDSFW